jgi:hypothetical protein
MLLIGLALWVAPAYEQGLATAQHESYVLSHWISRHPASRPNPIMQPLQPIVVSNTVVTGQKDPAIILVETLIQFRLMVKSSTVDTTTQRTRQTVDQNQTAAKPLAKGIQIHLSLDGDLKDFVLTRELLKVQHPEIVLVQLNVKKAPEDKQASLDSIWNVIASAQVPTS